MVAQIAQIEHVLQVEQIAQIPQDALVEQIEQVKKNCDWCRMKIAVLRLHTH